MFHRNAKIIKGLLINKVCVCARVQARRLAAITELVRLLKVGGHALIYVWAMEQEYKNQKSKYLKTTKNQENIESLEPKTELDETNSKPIERQVSASLNLADAEEACGRETPPKLSVHTNRTAFESQDLLVPWHLKGEVKASSSTVFHRFYHVFQRGELEDLCASVNGVEVQQSYYDQGNWCVILQKTSQQQ